MMHPPHALGRRVAVEFFVLRHINAYYKPTRRAPSGLLRLHPRVASKIDDDASRPRMHAKRNTWIPPRQTYYGSISMVYAQRQNYIYDLTKKRPAARRRRNGRERVGQEHGRPD
eukprot:2350916-Pleurochrysis_carterae.AAC.3